MRDMRFIQCLLTVMIGVSMTSQTLAQQPAGGGPAARPMTLTTTAFLDGGQIPAKYTQAGEQVSPALAWTNTPAGAVTFVLHMHDIDVARNKTLDDQAHWVVWNIPGTATGLPEEQASGAKLPDGSYQFSATGQVYCGPG